MIELIDEGHGIQSININGNRVGSMWGNRDGSASIVIQPNIWNAPYRISEEESHQVSWESIVILRSSTPKAKKDE